MSPGSALTKLQNYHRENGSYLSLVKLIDTGRSAIRSRILSRRFKAANWNVGRDPLIIGASHIRVGDGFRCGHNLWLEAITRYEGQSFQPTITIGDNVALSNAVHISAISTLSIGDDVLIGSHVHVADHYHGNYKSDLQSDPSDRPSVRRLTSPGDTIIGDRVWLGNGVVVLPGVHIGNGAIIGANSVVIANIPPESIAAGAPARVVKTFDRNTAQWRRAE
jgi:lipopolysaccharide O-acetyltransferase